MNIIPGCYAGAHWHEIVHMPTCLLKFSHIFSGVASQSLMSGHNLLFPMQLSTIPHAEPTFMKAQTMPNLFGHAHIQYFDTKSACTITYT